MSKFCPVKSGVTEQGQWQETTEGRGRVRDIAGPCKSLQWRKKQAKGDVIVVRYSDVQHKDQAERFLAALQERLARFGLELHREKTAD